MPVSAAQVKELRDKTGAGIMACKRALEESGGDISKAEAILNEKGLASAARKAGRSTSEGLVVSYIHKGGRVGSMVELNCETDFVARTEEFEALGHNLAMQIAAMSPLYVDRGSVPEDADEVRDEELLLEQEYIRDSSMKIADLVTDSIGKLGENIRIRRFSRFELGG
ncbi:MAG: translation elongation factor Ts [Chloroflexi bacterium]|nr:translation elongation factor Ts [Chloroflexota bacterium]MCH8114414.1 translation elongation factor Ts [Chloroflexota bacterium]MCI0774531.1 translation elongation factor Ts [Chloroflexota bacterium]MCI0803644.1 translation elongation factor Ts [Chloroflexota bacterium]MCI0807709.1 translation elongation factor Ts [Chloroflexota bacterium]